MGMLKGRIAGFLKVRIVAIGLLGSARAGIISMERAPASGEGERVDAMTDLLGWTHIFSFSRRASSR
jgi:hypothetical protein